MSRAHAEPQGLTLAWGGGLLELRPEGAAFLPDQGTLLIADFHLGKAHSFRRLGMPVPAGTTLDMLARLDALLLRLPVRRVAFLGDFLHSASAHGSPALAAFADWRAGHAALGLVLVRGNHDERAGDPPVTLGISVVDEPWHLGAWALCHRPQTVPEAFALSGHIHPCAVVQGPVRDHLRLPCFHLAERVAVLPAFGGFTGMHALPREAGARRYVSDGQRVRSIDG